MGAVKAFVDSNVLLYLLSTNKVKADRAEKIINDGGIISIQVLNEVANVARRKLRMSWPETTELLTLLRAVCTAEPLTIETHERGMDIAERHNLSVYDAMIAAAALLAGCGTLYSEDMQDGLMIDGRLRVRNPFAGIFD